MHLIQSFSLFSHSNFSCVSLYTLSNSNSCLMLIHTRTCARTHTQTHTHTHTFVQPTESIETCQCAHRPRADLWVIGNLSGSSLEKMTLLPLVAVAACSFTVRAGTLWALLLSKLECWLVLSSKGNRTAELSWMQHPGHIRKTCSQTSSGFYSLCSFLLWYTLGLRGRGGITDILFGDGHSTVTNSLLGPVVISSSFVCCVKKLLRWGVRADL